MYRPSFGAAFFVFIQTINGPRQVGKTTAAGIIDNDEELVEWKHTDLAREIKSMKTPGKVLKAYRERAGFCLVELAEKIGTKYPIFRRWRMTVFIKPLYSARIILLVSDIIYMGRLIRLNGWTGLPGMREVTLVISGLARLNRRARGDRFSAEKT